MRIFVCVLSLLAFSYCYPQSNLDISIVKPNSEAEKNLSGDKQHQKLGEKLSQDILLRVVKNDSIPMADYPIKISLVGMPSGAKGCMLDDTLVYTNKDGFARSNITIGDKEGEYEIVASIQSDSFKNYLVYTFYGRSSKWFYYLLFGLVGGLGLFLFGMELMSTGIQKTAGDKIRTMLGKVTRNRAVSLGAGAVFTVIIQSSSAMAVMLVSFVNTRLMKFKDTMPILIGAAIGTTITAQLIAIKITDVAIVVVGVGAMVYLFSKKASHKNIGEAILGFGVLFYGLKIMSEAMYPLRSYEPFLDFLLSLENPFLGIAAGALFTALIHSSSACIGIIIIFASQGLISLESGMYLLLGANLGTPATALMACVNTSPESRKVAYAQLFYKIFMVLLFVGLVPLMVRIFDYVSYRNVHVISNELRYDTLPLQIANAHTVINIIMAMIMFPLSSPFVRFINMMFPTRQEEPLYKIKYLDKQMISSPAIALNLAKQETTRLGRKIHKVLEEVMIPFVNNDAQTLDDIQKRRDEIKAIRDEIKTYVLKLSRNCDERMIKESFVLMHVVHELSHINDATTKILHRRAEKWIDRGYQFSIEGREEIVKYHRETLMILTQAIVVFNTLNQEKAKALRQKRQELLSDAMKIEQSHYERMLKENAADIQNSKTHLELINVLNIVAEHSFNIVRLFADEGEREESATRNNLSIK